MLPLLAGALALGAGKTILDGVTGVRQQRAARRQRDRMEENEATQEHDQRRAAIMRSLGVDAPIMPHQLQDVGDGPDLTGANILSGLLGFGSNALASGAASGPAAARPPSDVPMPYQQQDFTSIYGPGSRIKPGTPYR